MLRSLVVMTFALLFSAISFACPFTLLNDSNSKVLAVDPFNHQAIELPVGKQAVIDISVNGWQKYFRNENLDIYYPLSHNSSNYFRKYRLIEKYCTDDVSKYQFKISDIVKLVKTPTKQFSVQAFYQKPKMVHLDKH